MRVLNNLFLNENECICCEVCVNTCPIKAFKTYNNHVIIDNQKKAYCINCGDCISVCPKGAIKTEDNLCEDLNQDYVELHPEQLLNFLKNRRSVRSFKPVALNANEKEYLTNVASLVPKGGHTQSIRNTGIVIVENKELIEDIIDYTYEYMRALENKLNSVWMFIPKAINSSIKNNISNTTEQIDLFLRAKKQNINMLTYDSPNLILLHSEKNSPISRENSTILEYQLMLGAEVLGLGTCFLGWVSFALQSYRIKKSDKLKSIYEVIKIPVNREILGAFCIGRKNSKYNKLKIRDDAMINIV